MKCYTLIQSAIGYTILVSIPSNEVCLCLFEYFFRNNSSTLNAYRIYIIYVTMRWSTWLNVFSWAAKIESRAATVAYTLTVSLTIKTTTSLLFSMSFFFFHFNQTMTNCALKLLKFNRFENRVFLLKFWERCASE